PRRTRRATSRRTTRPARGRTWWPRSRRAAPAPGSRAPPPPAATPPPGSRPAAFAARLACRRLPSVPQYQSHRDTLLREGVRVKIVIGSDHAGFGMKQELLAVLRADGHEVQDVGTHSTEPADYPDSAEAVGGAVVRGEAERGVLICGSGVGASVAANKLAGVRVAGGVLAAGVPANRLAGVRAAVCHDAYSAHQGVEHDDMNVLVLGARVIGP